MKVSKLLLLGAFVIAITFAMSAQAQTKFHGISFLKGAEGPIVVGEPYNSAYLISNTVDTAHDTLRVTSLVDTVLAAGGDAVSGNLLTILTWNLNAGSPAAYWDGVELVLPYGAAVESDQYSFYTSTLADWSSANPLVDTALLGWYDTCSGVSNNCSGLARTTDTVSLATIFNPDISISKVGDIEAFCEGSDPTVTYTYLVENTGDEDLTSVVVSDNTCSPVTPVDVALPVDGFNDGDTNKDGYLNPDEIWEYTCSMQLTATTLNLVDVDAIGLLTGTPVTDSSSWEVLEVLPPTVSVSPASAEICSTGEQELCAVVVPPDTTPTPTLYTYSWKKDDVLMVGETGPCITVNEAGTYCVTVTDIASKCDASACGELSVIEAPVCSINSGPRSLCEEDIGNPVHYCSDVVADNYLWEIVSGPATIQGGIDDQMCVDVVPTGLGTIVLKLTLSNNVPGDGVCEDFCQISITVEECGGAFCTFTQGYWGNEGGTKCDPKKTTTQLINQALTAAGGSIVVGVLGERSITFSSAADIILRLPCGGTPSALPEGLNVNANNTAALKTAKLLKKKDDRINNVLVGQVVALTLNLLVSDGCIEDSGDLGNYTFPEADYICVQKGEDGCIERHEIPESLQGLSVDALLLTANLALAGDEELVGGAYDGASFVNELFDECMTIVACPPEDSCDYCDADPLTCVD